VKVRLSEAYWVLDGRPGALPENESPPSPPHSWISVRLTVSATYLRDICLPNGQVGRWTTTLTSTFGEAQGNMLPELHRKRKRRARCKPMRILREQVARGRVGSSLTTNRYPDRGSNLERAVR
jgi:hypothetical protein